MKTRKARKEGNSGRDQLLPLYHACVANAEELADEAEILFEKNRFARAYALAFTALEEIGKAHLVADFYTGRASRQEFDAAFSQHRIKSAYLRRWVAQDPESREWFIEYDQRATEGFEIRNAALYVDWGVEFAPASPSDRVSKEVARYAINEVRRELYELLYQDYMGHQIGSKGRFK